METRQIICTHSDCINERAALLRKVEMLNDIENPHKCWTCKSIMPFEQLDQVVETGITCDMYDLQCPICESINVTSISGVIGQAALKAAGDVG
jgi:Zn finger protein HypA/HybF involved in hydrogenase expression